MEAMLAGCEREETLSAWMMETRRWEMATTDAVRTDFARIAALGTAGSPMDVDTLCSGRVLRVAMWMSAGRDATFDAQYAVPEAR